MEKIAHDISAKIALRLDYSDEKKDVIAYGLTAIFQLIFIGLAISVIGIIFDFIYESFVIFLGVGILKKSTGGAHSSSMHKCTIISIASILIMAILSRYVLSFQINIYINIVCIIVVYGSSLLVFKKKVPIDSPNKPIVRIEKIKRLRKQSFILLMLYIMISSVFLYFAPREPRFMSVSYSILLAIVWQTLMLTKFGSMFIKTIDKIFM